MIANSLKTVRRQNSVNRIIQPSPSGLITQVGPTHIPVDDVPLAKLPEALESFEKHKDPNNQLAIIIRPSLWKMFDEALFPLNGKTIEETFHEKKVAVYLALHGSAVKRAMMEIVHYWQDKAVIFYVHRAE